MKQSSELILASGSPRRSALLSQMGVEHVVVVTDVDETTRADELPRDYVCRLAVEKALAGQRLLGRALPSLGADTVVLLDAEILGKPGSRLHAAEMLRSMSNRDHEVLSAVALAPAAGPASVLLNTTRVSFAELPELFIDHYCASGEPMDKAGAYAIQGELGMYVAGISGSYSGVMGLPLYETGILLRSAGVLV